MKHCLLLLFLSFPFFGRGQDTVSVNDFRTKDVQITSVKPHEDYIIISGFDSSGKFFTKHVKLTMNSVLKDWTTRGRMELSLIIIPIKVRRTQDNIAQNVFTGLSNVGFNIGLLNYGLDKYYLDGRKSTHRLHAGILVAPAVEELNPSNTNNYVSRIYKQLFFTIACSLTYIFNDVSFSIIPAGFDFATTNDGREYMYNKKSWWGFGIGINTKLLSL